MVSEDQLSSGDRVLINGREAEVINTKQIGGDPYLRVFFADDGPKTVSVADVDIEQTHDTTDTLQEIADELHPDHDLVSADHFDLRSQALQLKIAHEQGQLLSISNSLVRLEPYQLACVNWVMEKLRQRALIADDVGLGKTIEAGLILKELAARNRADRVLFVVPAHLRKKWIRDMARFFDIDLTVADRTWVDAERRRIGEEANIWNQDDQQLVVSMAFIRQDEFRQELRDAFWDVVVVDEAHKASKRGDSPSKTARAVETITDNSDALLLLSATPHDGKGPAFRSLIEYIDPFLVAEDRELTQDDVNQVMIRRGKQTIYDDDGDRIFPDREVKTVSVEMTDDEEAFYDDVSDYVQNVYNRSDRLNKPAVGFAMALMQKRLVSSIGAIRETLRRRRDDFLSDQHDHEELSYEARTYLEGEDLDEDEKQQAEQELAGLTVAASDAELEEEIETLQKLVADAEALPVDSKATKVRRFIQELLEEQPDEKLLLFTEYRDTLEYLIDFVSDEPWADEILVIHGGVDKDDRARIEDEFNHGEARLLFATDAASEGIDLQHSCHIMVNYELPWNPNRLEQRIGRIHRYGQDQEVKVWNFSFEGTREAEIFEMLQDKIEQIRTQLGNTADVLGMLDDIDLDSLIMESIQDNEPASATKEELEELIDERQRTLEEWYDRSLLDTSTFDAESRERIQEVVDDSEDVYGSEDDIRDFVIEGIRTIGGEVQEAGHKQYNATLPEEFAGPGLDTDFGPFTFDREFALDHDDLIYVSPDTDLVQRLLQQVLGDDTFGSTGLKVLPFVDNPGVVYNYRVSFEDGTGETIQEQMIPVFVESETQDTHSQLGRRVLDNSSVTARPDGNTVTNLFDQQDALRQAGEEYISQKIRQIRSDIEDDRGEKIAREREKLEQYAEDERTRIQQYIDEYQEKDEAGSEMDIAIRRQRQRLDQLKERLDRRKAELDRQQQIISLAPEIENTCFVFPT